MALLSLPQAEVVEAANTSSGRDGPSLARFWGSRLTAAQLNAWVIGGPVDSSVLRVYWMGGSPSAAASREQLVQQLRAAAAPPGPLRLQCYPRTMEAPLADELDGTEGFDLQPVNPAWVLHIVQLPPQREEQQPGGEAAQGSPAQQQQTQQQRQQRYLWSLQPAADQYLYAAAREKRIPNQLSKAAGKLAEALAVAGVRFTSGTAVDLGAAPGERVLRSAACCFAARAWLDWEGGRRAAAAPAAAWCKALCLSQAPLHAPPAGGWTQVLARHAQRVIAVDPAAMDPRVAQLPSVTHLACKAEDAVERIHELAGASGIDLLVSGEACWVVSWWRQRLGNACLPARFQTTCLARSMPSPVAAEPRLHCLVPPAPCRHQQAPRPTHRHDRAAGAPAAPRRRAHLHAQVSWCRMVQAIALDSV